MPGILPLSEEERDRVRKMAANLLDIICAHISLADGKLDEQTKARLLQRNKEAGDQLDVRFALDLADRLGEDAFRQALEEYTPPNARASIDALIKLEGGALPLVKNRIDRMRSGADTMSFPVKPLSEAGGCGIGAVAIGVGLVGGGIGGGFLVVVGIMMMASEC